MKQSLMQIQWNLSITVTLGTMLSGWPALSITVTLGTMLSGWPAYRGWWCTILYNYISGWTLELILLAGIIIEGDLPNQVVVSTGSTVPQTKYTVTTSGSLQGGPRSKLIAKELLGPNQVVFIES